MANYVVTDTELTNVANSIREKSGTTESLSWPTEYINAIEDMQTGGNAEIYTSVHISYPTGSICSITNGTTTLTASNTSGEVLFGFVEPNTVPEQWEASCIDPLTDDTDEATISINTQGENIDIRLAYADPILNNNSWATISAMAYRGVGNNYWDIGDKKEIILNGTIGTLSLNNFSTYVYILDFNYSENNIIFGGFKNAAGTDLALTDSKYNTSATGGTKYFNMNHKGNSNCGGWKGCDFRYDILGATDSQPSPYNVSKTTNTLGYDATINAITNPVANTLMAALPSNFRNVLRLRSHYVDNKGNKSNSSGNVTTVIDAISLLAEYEVCGRRTYANTYEQNHQKYLAYYQNGNSVRKFSHNNISNEIYYLLSSPVASDAAAFDVILPGGSLNNGYGSMWIGTISPVFMV